MHNNTYRNKLINILGENLTNAQILYSSVEELEEIKEKLQGLFERHLFRLYEDNEQISNKLDKLCNFLAIHIDKVGKFQAVKDLQLALTLLNKNKKNSICTCKNALLEDGIYGIKTHKCIYDVCKNYPLKVIKNT